MANIQEVTLAMIHDQGKRPHTAWGDILLDDNFDDEMVRGFSYLGAPVKIMFTIVLLCVKGSIRFRINLKEMMVNQNDILLITPGAIMDMCVVQGDCRVACIHIDSEKHEKKPTMMTMLRLRSMLKNEVSLTHVRDIAMTQIVNSYKLMRLLMADGEMKCKEDAVQGCFQVIGACWMSEMETNSDNQEKPRLTRNEQLFQMFLRLVRQEYMRHRDVSYYAGRLAITAKYLGVVVSQSSGRRPLDWIRDHVILDAKAMLVSRQYTIQQISHILNFPNPSFFSKYFRESVGLSPSRYLNEGV